MSLKPPDSTTDSISTWGSLNARIEVIEEAPLLAKSEPYNLVGDGSDESVGLLAYFTDLNATKRKGYIGAGNFQHTIPTGLPITGEGIHLEGAGKQGTGSVHTKIYNQVGHTFSLSSCNSLHMEHMVVQNLGGNGHCFTHSGNCSHMVFEHILANQAHPDKSIYFLDSAVGGKAYVDNTWRNCELQHSTTYPTGPTPTVPAFYMRDNVAEINRNTWQNLRCTYSGDYFFHIESTDVGNYQYDNVFRDINFEICNGGLIRGLSSNGFVIENCKGYDMHLLPTIDKDLIFLGDGSGGFRSAMNIIRNFSRVGGTLGAGVKDIKLDVTDDARLNLIEHCYQTTLTGFTVDLGGNDAVLINNSINTLENITANRVIRMNQTGIQSYSPIVLGDTTVPGAGLIYIEGFEQSADPAAPAANGGRLFFKDNGAGKTQLVVRFNTGATQVIATQP